MQYEKIENKTVNDEFETSKRKIPTTTQEFSKTSDITDVDNNELTSHCWIKLKKSQEKILEPKHTYTLKGTITTYYKKGKDGSKEMDYCLCNITEVKEVV